jgi:hypothetical protein
VGESCGLCRLGEGEENNVASGRGLAVQLREKRKKNSRGGPAVQLRKQRTKSRGRGGGYLGCRR